MMPGFVVEEGKKNKADKTSVQEAVYSGNFGDYIVSKARSSADTLIVADMFSDRDGVDVVDSSVKQLVFRDEVKNFSDLLSNLSAETASGRNRLFFSFENDFKITSGVKSIKIFINGFDENSESVSLNLELLNQNSFYKYKIAADAIEMSIIGELDAKTASNILKSFTYKKISGKNSCLKEIYVIIDGKLVYKTGIKF